MVGHLKHGVKHGSANSQAPKVTQCNVHAQADFLGPQSHPGDSTCSPKKPTFSGLTHIYIYAHVYTYLVIYIYTCIYIYVYMIIIGNTRGALQGRGAPQEPEALQAQVWGSGFMV